MGDEDEDEDEDDDDDDADLRAALLMSQGLAADSTTPSIPSVDSTEGKKDSEDDNATTTPPGNYSFNDPDFVQNMLRGLPGVDPDDERIKAALAQISGNKSGDDKDKKKGDDK